MTGKFDSWQQESEEWRDVLSRKLKEALGDDLVVSYYDVSRSFPSTKPHPYSFEVPLIDQNALVQWAKENGWLVNTATDVMAENSRTVPNIRFRR